MKPIQCPFCADDKAIVIGVEERPAVLTVRCPECGAIGPTSHTTNPAHAISAWNQRFGRLFLVK